MCLKQDPDAKAVYIIWYERESYANEDPIKEYWEYMVYFDKSDYDEDLEWIRDRYTNIKVRIYKHIDSFDIKEPEVYEDT